MWVYFKNTYWLKYFHNCTRPTNRMYVFVSFFINHFTRFFSKFSKKSFEIEKCKIRVIVGEERCKFDWEVLIHVSENQFHIFTYCKIFIRQSHLLLNRNFFKNFAFLWFCWHEMSISGFRRNARDATRILTWKKFWSWMQLAVELCNNFLKR